MNKREITVKNIEEFGLLIGKPRGRKGTEIFRTGEYIAQIGEYYLKDVKQVERVKNLIIEKSRCKKLFVSNIKFTNGDSYNYEDHISLSEASANKFNPHDIAMSNFKDIEYITVYAMPELLGYLALNSYPADYDTQRDLMKELCDLDGQTIYGEPTDSSWDEPEKGFEFDSRDSNGDYSKVWGSSVVEDTDECIFVEGRVYNGNDSVMDDFWNFTMCEDHEYFKEIDPKEKICVYHRKGKDWYVGYNLEKEEKFFTFRDEDEEECEEEFVYFWVDEDKELAERFAEIVNDWRHDLEVRSELANMLNIGDMYGYGFDGDSFNLKILNIEYDEDLYDARNDIEYFLRYEGDPREDVLRAYERFLLENTEDNLVFGKYRHLKQLKRYAEADGNTLVYTKIGEFTEDMAYAIKVGDNEYHFSMLEMLDAIPTEFYKKIISKLENRIEKVYASEILMKKASSVFVGLEDSYSGGNCKVGTMAFCSKHRIDTKKIGGIRGDVLLGLDTSDFTRKAVLSAIKGHAI